MSFETGDVITNEVELGEGNPSMTGGTGDPLGVVTAPVGSIFVRSDGVVGNFLTLKESGTGAFGWSQNQMSYGNIAKLSNSNITINTINVWEPVTGTYSINAGRNRDFVLNGNSLEYTGALTRQFYIFLSTAVGDNGGIAASTAEIGIRINSTDEDDSAIQQQVTLLGGVQGVSCMWIGSLSQNDTVTAIVRNTTNTDNYTLGNVVLSARSLT